MPVSSSQANSLVAPLADGPSHAFAKSLSNATTNAVSAPFFCEDGKGEA